MLDSLYGDLPPPTTGEGEKNVSPAPSGSLLGSLYDDPDDLAESSSNIGGPSGASKSSAGAAGAATDTNTKSAAWAAQRLKLLTPAVVRRQTLAKTAPKASPSLNVQAAAADAAQVLERLKKLHAGVVAEEQKPSDKPAAPGKAGTETTQATDPSGTPSEPIEKVVSVTVGSSTTLGPTTWVPVGLWPQEYDPSKPNDYTAIHREKVRQQQREELERLRQQEMEKQKLDEDTNRNGVDSPDLSRVVPPLLNLAFLVHERIYPLLVFFWSLAVISFVSCARHCRGCGRPRYISRASGAGTSFLYRSKQENVCGPHDGENGVEAGRGFRSQQTGYYRAACGSEDRHEERHHCPGKAHLAAV